MKTFTLKTDFTEWSDKDLLEVHDAVLNKTFKGGIPLTLSNEWHKRKLIKSYTGTFNSNMR
jgi:hypothetical protein